ncbi:MAG: hypothetical protein IPL96_14675 [Holophagaceae bacterium]|nr:hypothetical protein [Holophagaceae bacterium]
MSGEESTFTHPILSGVHVSPPAGELYEAVTTVVNQASKPDDTMYVFPNMPFLYALAGRKPATFGLAHWVDICPDLVGQQDAARLRARPPKIMVIRQDPLQFITGEERLYRDGRQSSVRDVYAALVALRDRYEIARVVRTGVSAPILILVRKDPPPRSGD